MFLIRLGISLIKNKIHDRNSIKSSRYITNISAESLTKNFTQGNHFVLHKSQ